MYRQENAGDHCLQPFPLHMSYPLPWTSELDAVGRKLQYNLIIMIPFGAERKAHEKRGVLYNRLSQFAASS